MRLHEDYTTGQFKELIEIGQLKVKRLTLSACMPRRATDGSAGYDLFADLPSAMAIHPGQTVFVKTGVAIEFDTKGFVALIYARSGLATNFGITLANSVGVIDSDYRGELIVALFNNSESSYLLHPSERVAQLVLTPIFTPEVVEVDELTETSRGNGGFGSTGRS